LSLAVSTSAVLGNHQPVTSSVTGGSGGLNLPGISRAGAEESTRSDADEQARQRQAELERARKLAGETQQRSDNPDAELQLEPRPSTEPTTGPPTAPPTRRHPATGEPKPDGGASSSRQRSEETPAQRSGSGQQRSTKQKSTQKSARQSRDPEPTRKADPDGDREKSANSATKEPEPTRKAESTTKPTRQPTRSAPTKEPTEDPSPSEDPEPTQAPKPTKKPSPSEPPSQDPEPTKKPTSEDPEPTGKPTSSKPSQEPTKPGKDDKECKLLDLLGLICL